MPMPDPAETKPGAYSLAFLTDEWEWEQPIAAETFDEAKAVSREALDKVVREEAPQLACVTLFQGERKVGVWDWIEKRYYWTPY